MQKRLCIMYPVLAFVFSLTTSVALPCKPEKDLPENNVMLNGKAVEFFQLSFISKGIISMTSLNPVSGKTAAIPFRIYLRRGGNIISTNAYAQHFAVNSYEIAEILQYAIADDQIVIEPAIKKDTSGLKVIPVKSNQLLPQQFKWYFGLTKTNGGC